MKSRKQINDRIKLLEDRKALLPPYAADRMSEEDYHGVADAAMDLRDTAAELQGLYWVID